MHNLKCRVRGLVERFRLGASSPAPRARRGATPAVDGLEGRLVLSSFGLAGRGLASSAQLAGPSGGGARGGPRGGIQDATLAADLQTYRSDVNSVLLGSTATDAERLALRNDLREVAAAGLRLDREALGQVADDLLAALSDDDFTSDEEAAVRDSFNALFAGSTVDQALIDQTFADFVTVADHLNIDADELATLSADRDAIAADDTRLGIGAGVDSNLSLILPGGGGRRGGGRC